ncbi:MAG: Ig-like domain-containing protein, partial [Methylococcales bacterium]|nr:Ig-like domain-containing protein [Methylococcales bacterium]
DNPVANPDLGAVNEDAALSVSAANGVILGAGGDSDVDNAITSLRVDAVAAGTVTSLIPGSGVATTISGTYGHLTLNADGSYSYTADNANALSAGVTASEVFSYSVLDPDGGVSNITTLTITVTGKNDNPVANPDLGAVNEDATLSVSAANGVILGAGADSDVDNLTTSLKVNAVAAGIGILNPSNVGTTISGTYGQLTLNADGSYSYTADNANTLAAGATANDVFSYSVVDPDGGLSNITTLTITVTGKNDNPVANPDLGAVNEDATLSVSAANGVILGAGADSDVDNTAASLKVNAVAAGIGILNPNNVGTTISGTYGHLTLNADGSYSYAADNANALAAGATASDVFSYTVQDPDGGVSNITTFSINVTGSNSPPTAVNDMANTLENSNLSVLSENGVLANDKDVDSSDSHIVSAVNGSASNVGASILGSNGGRFVIAADGSYRFIPGTSFDNLADGEVRASSIEYTNQDNNGTSSNATLTIFVNGINDTPIAVNDTIVNNSSINVLLNDTDPDQAQLTEIDINPSLPGIQHSYSNDQGTFTAVGGVVTFTANNPFLSVTSHFNYVAIDSAGEVSNVAAVGIDFQGTPNNAPLIAMTNPSPTFIPVASEYETYPLKKFTSSITPTFETSTESSDFGYASSADVFNQFYELRLVGSLSNQEVMESQNYSFEIPRESFQHSNPSEKLEFKATDANGSPLPAWLVFDSNKLRFSGIPPKGAESIDVLVTVTDTHGNEVQAHFTVNVKPLPEPPKLVQPTKPSFTQQIKAMVKERIVEESEEFIETPVIFPDFSIILDFDED